MRLNGFFKGNSPYILIGVKADKPKIRAQIHFLIDTGSDITGISRRDQLAMGRITKSGARAARSISGLAHKARTWEVKNAELRLMTANKKVERFEPMSIYLMDTTEECPSLLGRDFLGNFGLRLVCDIPNKKVYLEK